MTTKANIPMRQPIHATQASRRTARRERETGYGGTADVMAFARELAPWHGRSGLRHGDRAEVIRPTGWGDVLETTMAAASQKLEAMRDLTERRATVHLGIPGVRRSAGRSSPGSP
jgi:hypothetical protein